MSHMELFVIAQDVAPDQAEEAGRRLVDWAIAERWLREPVPGDRRGEMVGNEEPWWAPGERASAVNDANQLAAVVRVGNGLFFPGLGMDGPDTEKMPRCPNCDVALDEEELYDVFALSEEPTGWPIVKCGACGVASDWREWPGDDAPVIGYLALGVQDWAATYDERVADEFTAEIAAALGGRWRWVLERR